jgi:hypothetical protein
MGRNLLQDFQDALIIRAVVARMTTARMPTLHPSTEAMKEYLREHPNADPSFHKVSPAGVKREKAKAQEEEAQKNKPAQKAQKDKPESTKDKPEKNKPESTKFDQELSRVTSQGDSACRSAISQLDKLRNDPDGPELLKKTKEKFEVVREHANHTYTVASKVLEEAEKQKKDPKVRDAWDELDEESQTFFELNRDYRHLEDATDSGKSVINLAEECDEHRASMIKKTKKLLSLLK